ncbi:hypothetical protein HYX11_01090 [Candidatus Woesearchaeota archaeon]|nr:hypothetical protein [Candidatus Woesearchaeota archaeon]
MKTKAETVLALENEEFAKLEENFYLKTTRIRLLEEDALTHEEDCFMSGYENYDLENNETVNSNENQPNEIA